MWCKLTTNVDLTIKNEYQIQLQFDTHLGLHFHFLYSKTELLIKDGLLFKKKFIETEDFMFNYSTSKALLSDFQNNNFNHFIQNKKERVIFEDGHFL